MTTITYRDGLGRPLTTAEMDANFRSIVDNKVEVVAGKGLSTNDYTTGEKSKLAGIATGATVNQTDAYLLARANHTGTQAISTVVNLQSALDAKIPLTQKGAASGVAPLDSSGLVPSAYLPSYVDDVLEFANLAAFPTTGETGKIYVAIDTGKIYRWSSTIYVEISPSPGSTDAVPEGATNLYFTTGRVLATALAGLNTALTGDITNSDTILQAFGRLQNKWNNFAASVRAVALTGLSTTTATVVVATDSILVAIGKLQGQVSNANALKKCRIIDQKASGTNPQSLGAGTITRDLTTIKENDIGVTLASNAFTLPPGTYWIEVFAPAWRSGQHKAFIAIQDSPTVPLTDLIGSSEYAYDPNYGATSNSRIVGRITITTATTYVIRHYAASAGVAGTPSNLGATFPEVYTTLVITKEA